MPKLGKAYTATKEQREYGKRISKCWQAAVASIIEAGTILKEAEEKLGSKAWNEMVANECPFGRRTAEKLVKIADDIRLCDPDNAEYLPPYWTSLHLMTFLTDDEFEEGISTGVITPTVERKEIEKFLEICRAGRTATSDNEDVEREDEGSVDADLERLTVSAIGKAGQNTINGGQVNGENGVAERARWVKTSKSVATIRSEQPLSPWQIKFIEKGLAIIANKFPEFALSADFSKVKPSEEMISARMVLATEIREWLRHRTETYRESADAHEKALIEDAFYQLEREKSFHEDGGELPLNDIRNPKNPFYGWSRGQLFAYCKGKKIVTRYTPIQKLDFEAYLNALVYRHCTANEKAQDLAHLSLWRRSRSKNEKRAKLAKAALDMLVL
jgi:hypothetical protein